MNFFLKRLKEPSTFAGIAALFASFGLLGLNESQWNEIFGSVAVFAGVVAMLLEERNTQNNDEQSE